MRDDNVFLKINKITLELGDIWLYFVFSFVFVSFSMPTLLRTKELKTNLKLCFSPPSNTNNEILKLSDACCRKK